LVIELEETQTLIDLGLTLTQAKVYLALARSGQLKISEISRLSKVARPDVYRTLAGLTELGVVEQFVEAPVQFRALPMDKCLTLLFEKKTQEFSGLKKETDLLLKNFKSNEVPEFQTAASRFILIPQKETAIKRQREAIDEAQNSIDLILSWNRFYHGTGEVFAQSFKNALTRKINFRYILETPPTVKLSKQVLGFCKGTSCKIRFVNYQPKTILGIYDKCKLMLIVDPEGDLPGCSPALWTNNQSLIVLIQEYFDNLWQNAKEEPIIH
jgi:sugar-specific transcriptional regulator TrmB